MTSVVGFCENCVAGNLLEGEPTGSIVSGAYFAPAPVSTEATSTQTTTTTEKKCIVLLTDAFGLPIKNNAIIADKLAVQMGLDIWVPDMFEGSPLFLPHQLVKELPTVPGEKMTWSNWFKWLYTMITALPRIIANRPAVVDPRVDKFITELKKDKGYTKIGVVGYCLGGAAAARLAGRDLVQTVVIAHPGPSVPKSDINAISVPACFIVAEADDMFPPKYALECEAIMKTRHESGGPDYEFKEYKGVVHGFASRPNLTIPSHKEGFEGALEQTVNWFKKTL